MLRLENLMYYCLQDLAVCRLVCVCKLKDSLKMQHLLRNLRSYPDLNVIGRTRKCAPAFSVDFHPSVLFHEAVEYTPNITLHRIRSGTQMTSWSNLQCRHSCEHYARNHPNCVSSLSVLDMRSYDTTHLALLLINTAHPRCVASPIRTNPMQFLSVK